MASPKIRDSIEQYQIFVFVCVRCLSLFYFGVCVRVRSLKGVERLVIEGQCISCYVQCIDADVNCCVYKGSNVC